MNRIIALGLAAFLLAGCWANDMRDVRTASRMLSERQDPRFCTEQPGGCPARVPNGVQMKVASCALDKAEAEWTHPPGGLALPATRLTFAETMIAMDRRNRAGAGWQRKPAEDPADEDAAAARLAALFNAAVPGCVQSASPGG
ncbi:MAG: hypothetical protein U1E50_12180 [Caulobacteraceae bacterium]